ncbi:tetratricopeptide repeat protein [Bradyrhizobium liaoningense]|uniref:tetratricopeptide repeat protein n=1 Tax=Bradyrhizobium liaoningense TaxID=43992 RepID=UPI001BAB967D|nr:tetratricopeptide repeat protein [Bradyrhizobium liaoningense]MBR0705406.1 sel1 repeat family protein [Bradyrhizobium liaoningense]
MVLLSVGMAIASQAFADPIADADSAGKRGDYTAEFVQVGTLAQQGNASAQRRLGTMYASGRGVQQDYDEAEKWFLKAAAQGDLDSMWNIGNIYHRGRGKFPKDFGRAENWYSRAAERGHILSQTTLAFTYHSGDGVEKNDSLAATWFERAANQGSSDAQLMLGILYENGQGVPQDRVLAYKWLNIAAARPLPKRPPDSAQFPDKISYGLDAVNRKMAAETRDRLYREMTSVERAEGQRLTRIWRVTIER